MGRNKIYSSDSVVFRQDREVTHVLQIRAIRVECGSGAVGSSHTGIRATRTEKHHTVITKGALVGCAPVRQ